LKNSQIEALKLENEVQLKKNKDLELNHEKTAKS